jgi:hypothetical protein
MSLDRFQTTLKPERTRRHGTHKRYREGCRCHICMARDRQEQRSPAPPLDKLLTWAERISQRPPVTDAELEQRLVEKFERAGWDQ